VFFFAFDFASPTVLHPLPSLPTPTPTHTRTCALLLCKSSFTLFLDCFVFLCVCVFSSLFLLTRLFCVCACVCAPAPQIPPLYFCRRCSLLSSSASTLLCIHLSSYLLSIFLLVFSLSIDSVLHSGVCEAAQQRSTLTCIHMHTHLKTVLARSVL
jgi:hypothetical protein